MKCGDLSICYWPEELVKLLENCNELLLAFDSLKSKKLINKLLDSLFSYKILCITLLITFITQLPPPSKVPQTHLHPYITSFAYKATLCNFFSYRLIFIFIGRKKATKESVFFLSEIFIPRRDEVKVELNQKQNNKD